MARRFSGRARLALYLAAGGRCADCGGQHRAADRQRERYSQGLRTAAALRRFDVAVRRAESDAHRFRDAAQRQAEVLLARLIKDDVPAWHGFCDRVAGVSSARDVGPACAMLATIGLPCLLVHLEEWPSRPLVTPPADTPIDDTPVAVSVFSMRGAPVTDVLVLRPADVYHVGVSVRLPEWPNGATFSFSPASTVPF